jgi:hypothetical protein
MLEPPIGSEGMSILSESAWYVGASTAVALLLLGTLFVLGSPLALWVGVWPALEAFRSIAVFAAILVVCGIPANLVFVLALRDRYYVAADPIVDWLPWLPSGDWVLDVPCGGRYLEGASATTLRVAWALLAVPTWGVTFLICRRALVLF